MIFAMHLARLAGSVHFDHLQPFANPNHFLAAASEPVKAEPAAAAPAAAEPTPAAATDATPAVAEAKPAPTA